MLFACTLVKVKVCKSSSLCYNSIQQSFPESLVDPVAYFGKLNLLICSLNFPLFLTSWRLWYALSCPEQEHILAIYRSPVLSILHIINFQQNILKERNNKGMIFSSDNHYTELWFLNCVPGGPKA